MNKKTKIFTLTVLFPTVLALSLSCSTPGIKKKDPEPKILAIADSIYQLGYRDKIKGLKIAEVIFQESKTYKLDPKLLIAIILVESHFDQAAVSSTGDFSLAQINLYTWKKEFKRLNRSRLDEKKLKSDPPYAIKRMAEILSILAERHKKKSDWFGYYHSANPNFKRIYVRKVRKSLSQMKLAQRTISNYQE